MAQTDFLLHSPSTIIEVLCQISTREEQRAHAEFETKFGRRYSGSDDDWDALDKSYTAVDEAISICRDRIQKLAA